MRFHDLVIGLAAFLFAAEEAKPLHEPQMLGGHVTGDVARRGEFADRISSLQEHLHDPQAMRVSQRPEAFGGLGEVVERRESRSSAGFRSGSHFPFPFYIQIYRDITTCQAVR